MRLSELQKFILTKCGENKAQGKRDDFYSFYSKDDLAKRKKIIQDSIHRCLENLVAKDLLVAYGRKTAQKWFIDRVKFTSLGKQVYRGLIASRQRRLPIQ